MSARTARFTAEVNGGARGQVGPRTGACEAGGPLIATAFNAGYLDFGLQLARNLADLGLLGRSVLFAEDRATHAELARLSPPPLAAVYAPHVASNISAARRPQGGGGAAKRVDNSKLVYVWALLEMGRDARRSRVQEPRACSCLVLATRVARPGAARPAFPASPLLSHLQVLLLDADVTLLCNPLPWLLPGAYSASAGASSGDGRGASTDGAGGSPADLRVTYDVQRRQDQFNGEWNGVRHRRRCSNP